MLRAIVLLVLAAPLFFVSPIVGVIGMAVALLAVVPIITGLLFEGVEKTARLGKQASGKVEGLVNDGVGQINKGRLRIVAKREELVGTARVSWDEAVVEAKQKYEEKVAAKQPPASRRSAAVAS